MSKKQSAIRRELYSEREFKRREIANRKRDGIMQKGLYRER